MNAPVRRNEPRPPLGETDQPSAPTDDANSLDLSRLLDLDWQKGLVIMLTLLVGLVLIWVLWQVISPIQQTLVLFGLAAVIAFALSGPVNALAQHVGNRVVAILIVYALVVAFILGGTVLLAGPFVGEATALLAGMPYYANDLQARVPEIRTTLGNYGIHANVEQLKAQAASAVEQGATDVLKNLVSMLAGASAIVGDVLLVLVISLYLVLDGARLLARAMTLVPRRHRAKAEFFQDNLARVLGGYIRGQLILALIVGLAAGIGTAILGVPYALVFGVLAGLFELVPMFGPVLSAIPALLAAAFMPFPTVLWVLLLFVVIQQVENNVLAPRISGDAVGLHPLGAMLALLVGFQLAGLLGGLFAVPLAGLLRVLVGAAYRDAIANQPPSGRWVLNEAAPAIVFIDELDAIGRARGGVAYGGATSEQEQTLNQILSEMDGFTGREGVVVLAATNRPDVLDPALLRAGRFDRRVTVPPPDKVGRDAILRVHTRGVPLAADVDLKEVAASTPGLVGADLRNLVNEAALLAARRQRDEVRQADFMDSLEKIELGPARALLMNPAEKRRVAYHEGGHTILGLVVPGADPVNRVTIVPRGQALGVTYQRPEDDRHNYEEAYLRARIIGAMGGRAAEEVVYNGRTTGAENDMQQATDIARQMVTRWGMSDRVGPMSLGGRENPYLSGDTGTAGQSYSEAFAQLVDTEVQDILEQNYRTAVQLLQEHRPALDALAESLVEHETLDEQEILRVTGLGRAPHLVEEHANGRAVTVLTGSAT